ncbi:MAG: hypothetical protein ACXAC7_11210 [Candidatus Hodarchaeales archaeon]|jgi:hypothetical protein
MLINELLIAILASIISFIAFLVVVRKALISPLTEIKFLSVAFFCIWLHIIGALPASFLYTPDKIDPLGFHIHRLAAFIGPIGLLLYGLSLTMPNFKSNYRSILLLVIFTTVSVADAVVDYTTMTDSIINGNIRVNHTPLAMLLIISTVVCFIYILAKRIIDVSRIVFFKERTSPFMSYRFMSFNLILTTIALFSLIYTRMFPDSSIPGNIWFLPTSMALFYFSYAFSKDEAFLFITPAIMEAIVITDHKTGLVVFSQSFSERFTETPQQILGGIFTALNISLKEAVQASRIEKISYGDKVILNSVGIFVTTFFIVSENNFITQTISKYLTEQFEKQFVKKLIKMEKTGVLNLQDFQEFSLTIAKTRQYMPL